MLERPLAAPPAADAARSSPASRAALRIGAAGVAVYALALLATLPARLVLPKSLDAAGTVWSGEAALGGGHVATWRWSPLASLAAFGIAAGWTLDGPDSALRGQAAWRPFAGLDLTDVRGRAGWSLVALAAPTLPLACDFGFQVALDRVAVRAAAHQITGTVRAESGTCTARVPGASRSIPRLLAVAAATADGTTGQVTPWANRAERLADFGIAGGRLRVDLTPRGAALIPGGALGDIEIEL